MFTALHLFKYELGVLTLADYDYYYKMLHFLHHSIAFKYLVVVAIIPLNQHYHTM